MVPVRIVVHFCQIEHREREGSVKKAAFNTGLSLYNDEESKMNRNTGKNDYEQNEYPDQRNAFSRGA